MIPEVEIREFARKSGAPETTVERDYAQNWLLSSLSLNMALKGGTGIRKVYIGDYRFSDDLDFTLLEDMEPDKVKDLIVKAVREAKRKSGIDFDENIRFEEVENGYVAAVYFRILRRTGNPLRIKIDITKRENDVVVLPLERRKIIHPYSDNCDAEVLTYSLQEIFAEKIRSLFQRTRPRDLYDVWYLSKLGLDVSGIINQKFRFKRVEPDFDGLLGRKEDFRNAWESSLRHQLKDLPEFNAVFDDVMKFIGGVLMSGRLKKLIENRDVILLAEIGALIHDLGKLSEEFISNKSSDNPLNINDKHAKWVFDWYTTLEDKLDIRISINNEQISLKNIIKKHHKGGRGLVGFFSYSADYIDSGIDKGAVVNLNKQKFSETFISTSFGYEFERVEVKRKALKHYRDEFVNVLEKVFEEIRDLLKLGSGISAEKWVELRGELVKKAKECFIHGLGETRRSANDVTLWDHSYSTATLYKSALAGVVISGKWVDPSKIKWCLLSVRFNGIEYIMKSSKIGDILGRIDRVEESLYAVKKLLEVYVPLGNEVYRDENGSVFLVPDIEDLEKYKLGEEIKIETRYSVVEISESATIEEAIDEIFRKIILGEIKPRIEPSEASRGAVILGKVLEDNKNKVLFNQPFVGEIKKKWGDGGSRRRAPVCKVCRVKPCKEREDKGYYDLCSDCMEIREKRAKLWYNGNRDTTIWIDEVSDENKRVGLIVGSFDLKNWLNGMWLNTTFTKTLKDLKKELPGIFEKMDWGQLIKAVEEAMEKDDPDETLSVEKSVGNSLQVKELLRAIGGDSYRNQKANNYFDAVVKEREEDVVKWAYGIEDISKLSNEERAKLLTLFLFRKNPSFARMRRIWETCNSYWDRVEKAIENELGRRVRYEILLDDEGSEMIKSLKANTAYEVRCEGYRIPVFFSGEKLVVIDTIDDVSTKEDLEAKLKNGFEIWESSGYGARPGKICDNLKAKGLVVDSNYKPFIRIVKSPALFICLLPLNSAWEILLMIKRLYEIEFSKVQNRLPLKLGLIAFKRKYPLYIALDAVKRLVEQDIDCTEKIFVVEEIERLGSEENCLRFNGLLGNYAYKIKAKNTNRKIEFFVSESFGDSTLRDFFYPYFVVLEGDDEVAMTTWIYKSVAESFGIDKEVILKHVSQLKPGDRIIFEPSFFDFEFLDSNIRRLDIGKERKHWLFVESANKPKPYLLWDVDNFERLGKLVQKLELTNTQIMNLYEMLVSKIEEWELKDLDRLGNCQTFKKLVESSIKGHPLRLEVIEGESGRGKISGSDYEFLVNSILNGLFFDFVDLWHTIFKKDFRGGEK